MSGVSSQSRSAFGLMTVLDAKVDKAVVDVGASIAALDGKTSPGALTLPGGSLWVPRSATAVANWTSVCHAQDKGLFVAVGWGNNIMTGDDDGVTWTSRSISGNTNWSSVCYAPDKGVFVAVSQSGTHRVATSSDGINWTGHSVSGAANWQSVCYAQDKGLFVAVGWSNNVMTSPDGAVWTRRSISGTTNWNSVCYGNGLFVAVSQNGTHPVMTSEDGITWTARSAPWRYHWKSVCYGKGLFVAVGWGHSHRIMTSPDGVTWTNGTSPQANNWNSVCYSGELFVAVSQGPHTHRVMTSDDGVIWTGRTAAQQNIWNAVCHGNGTFVAVSNGGANRVMTSTGTESTVAGIIGTRLAAGVFSEGTWQAFEYDGEGNRTDIPVFIDRIVCEYVPAEETTVPMVLSVVEGRIIGAPIINGAVSTEFIPVTNITGIDTAILTDAPHILMGRVEPANATRRNIEWSIEAQGTTGAAISDNILTATAAGDIVLRATVINGESPTSNYTQLFTISVLGAFVPVTEITDVLSQAFVGIPLALSGTVVPNDATYRTIHWSVADSGTTGATITNNVLTVSEEGTLTIMATVINGVAIAVDYTQEFLLDAVQQPQNSFLCSHVGLSIRDLREPNPDVFVSLAGNSQSNPLYVASVPYSYYIWIAPTLWDQPGVGHPIAEIPLTGPPSALGGVAHLYLDDKHIATVSGHNGTGAVAFDYMVYDGPEFGDYWGKAVGVKRLSVNIPGYGDVCEWWLDFGGTSAPLPAGSALCGSVVIPDWEWTSLQYLAMSPYSLRFGNFELCNGLDLLPASSFYPAQMFTKATPFVRTFTMEWPAGAEPWEKLSGFTAYVWLEGSTLMIRIVAPNNTETLMASGSVWWGHSHASGGFSLGTCAGWDEEDTPHYYGYGYEDTPHYYGYGYDDTPTCVPVTNITGLKGDYLNGTVISLKDTVVIPSHATHKNIRWDIVNASGGWQGSSCRLFHLPDGSMELYVGIAPQYEAQVFILEAMIPNGLCGSDYVQEFNIVVHHPESSHPDRPPLPGYGYGYGYGY